MIHLPRLLFLPLLVPALATAQTSPLDIPEPGARMDALVHYEQRFPDGDAQLSALLAIAKDKTQPDGVRAEALKAYARMARRLSQGKEAAVVVRNFQGVIGGLADPTWDALALLGAPALPVLLDGASACAKKPAVDAAMDAHAFRATAVRQVVTRSPAEAQFIAPELVKGLRCKNRVARRAYAQSLAALPALDTTTLARVRRLLAHDGVAEIRSLAAAVLSESGDASPETIAALERALADRADLVRLSAAKALWARDKKDKATPVLEKIRLGRNAEFARLADTILESDKAAVNDATE